MVLRYACLYRLAPCLKGGIAHFALLLGEPKLVIFGISFLVLVSNLKNCGVLINFICMTIKKQLTNKIQPLEYKKYYCFLCYVA